MRNSEIAYRRLFNQHIDYKRFKKVEDVVHWMGAIQAQSYKQSLWAIGSRMQSATTNVIEQALTERKIIRTWPMRGTIHFVPAEDAKWMLKLSAPRMLSKDKGRQKRLGLDEEVIEHCKVLFYNALKGNRQIPRPKMMDLLEASGISTKNGRGYHILWYTSQIGLICMGPRQDKQDTFVLLDEWVPNSKELSRDESLAELARRYFFSHGPATIHDFAWWAGLTVADARKGIEAIKPNLITEKVHNKDYWMTNSSMDYKRLDKSSVLLLPGFDEYLLGYKDRSAVLCKDHAQNVVPGNNGMFLPIIIEDGQVIGTWKSVVKRSAIEITTHLFNQCDGLEEVI